MFKRAITRSILATTMLCLACGGGGKTAAQAAADAKKEEKKVDAKMEAAIAKRKAEREAKEKEAKEAEEKIKAAIDAAAVLPEKLPKNVEAGCKEVANAHDRFMKRLYDGTALEKWNSGVKDTQMAMTTVQCSQADSVKVAGCQINALDTAGPELKKKLPELFRTCISKYAKKGGVPPSSAPPKRK
jgi:hypothetical protein